MVESLLAQNTASGPFELAVMEVAANLLEGSRVCELRFPTPARARVLENPTVLVSEHFCYTMSEARWLSGKPTGPDSRGRRGRQESAVFSMAQLDILASDRDEVDSTKATKVDTFGGCVSRQKSANALSAKEGRFKG